MAASKICSINGCSKPAQARGWCQMHYMRFYKHNDPMIVLKEKGKNWAWLVDVAAKHIGNECLIWPFDRASNGYARVIKGGRKISASREVCRIVSGDPHRVKDQAAHSCGNGHLGCVNPRHIRWATVAENHADKQLHGTVAKGERNGNAKHDERTVRKIKSMIGSMSQNEIARACGVSRSLVRDVKLGKTWGWI